MKNSKTQTVTKLNNNFQKKNSDKTQNINCDKTKKKQIMTKLKNSNCDSKSEIV